MGQLDKTHTRTYERHLRRLARLPQPTRTAARLRIALAAADPTRGPRQAGQADSFPSFAVRPGRTGSGAGAGA